MLETFGKWEKEDGFLGEQGYYKVPGFPDFSVKVSGEVFDKVKGGKLKLHYSKSYVTCSLNGYTKGVHVLICRAFVKPSKELLGLDSREVIVNHLDGNKHNFYYKNLEWVTYAGNSNHAYRTGLRTENNKVFARNIKTGEIFDFYSQAQLAIFFEVDPANVVFWMKSKKIIRTFKGYFQLSYEENNWNEVVLDKENISRRYDIFAKSVDPEKMSYLFPSCKAASEFLGIQAKTLNMHFRRYGSKPYHGFEFHPLWAYLDKIDSENYQKRE